MEVNWLRSHNKRTQAPVLPPGLPNILSRAGGSAASRGPLSYFSVIRLSINCGHDQGDQLILICSGLFQL